MGANPSRVTCETNQVLIAGETCGFSRGNSILANLHIGCSRYEWYNHENYEKVNNN